MSRYCSANSTIRFCCSRCLESFELKPSDYLRNMPQFRPEEPAIAADEGFLDGLGAKASAILDGLGSYVGWADGWEIVLAVVLYFAIQIPLSIWWLKHFRYGPMEYFWRLLTYGRRALSTQPTAPSVTPAAP